jgi:hypothetical protein
MIRLKEKKRTGKKKELREKKKKKKLKINTYKAAIFGTDSSGLA